MATPNVGILTTTGKALIDKVNSGQAKISFSKVIFSSMDNSQLSDTQIKALTAIAPQEVVVSSPQTTLDTNSGETRIRATGTNETLADGVYVKTYGVFAKDDTGNEILYGVTVSPNPNYFPAYDGVTPQAVTYSYKTVIQETSNITMTNSNDVYVSQEDLTEAIAKIPQPDLSGYDKTDDVDKKLQNKQDKLGFTAANDSKVVHDNGNGTIQVDGIQVNPYNKLTDIMNSRNIVLQTDNVIPRTAKGGNGESIQNFPLYSGFSSLPAGTKVYYSYDLKVTNADGGVHWLGWATPWNSFVSNQTISTDGIHHFEGTSVIPDADLIANQGIHSTIDKSKATYQIMNLTIVVGSIPVAHLPAPEDKADDSKVAHLSGANNFDTTPTVNNNPLLLASSLPSDLARTSQQTNFPSGLQSGGVDVATAADIKSVKDSAWREITNPAFQGSYLFRDNQDGTVSLSGTIYFTKPTQKYKGLDDYSIPLPDGYKATGMSSSGAIMGFINDYSITAEMLSAYFSGNILHLYSSLSEDRSMSISLCSIMKSELAIITSGPVILNVIK